MGTLLFLLLLGTVFSFSASNPVSFISGNSYEILFWYSTTAQSVNSTGVTEFVTSATLSFEIVALSETYEPGYLTLQLDFSTLSCLPGSDNTDSGACDAYANFTTLGIYQMTQAIAPPNNYGNCYYSNKSHEGCVLFSRLLNLLPYPADTVAFTPPSHFTVGDIKPDAAWKSVGTHHKSLRPVYRKHYWFRDGNTLMNQLSLSKLSDQNSVGGCQIIQSSLVDDSEAPIDDANEFLENNQTICYSDFGPSSSLSVDAGIVKNTSNTMKAASKIRGRSLNSKVASEELENCTLRRR
jgi:hypothetical protein